MVHKDKLLLFISILWLMPSAAHILGITVIIKIKRNWKNQHVALLSLSVSSVIALVFEVPIVIYSYTTAEISATAKPWDVSLYYYISKTIRNTALTTYCTAMAFLLLDRLIAVTKPMQYCFIYPMKTCIKWVVLSWTIIILLFLILFSIFVADTRFLIIKNVWNLDSVFGVVFCVCSIFVHAAYVKILYTLYRRPIMTNIRNQLKQSMKYPTIILITSSTFYTIPIATWKYLLKDVSLNMFTKEAIFLPFLLVGNLVEVILYMYMQPAIKKGLKKMISRRVAPAR